MTYTEILFKVGNGTKATDGMPVAVAGSGFLITGAMMTDFIQNSTVPPGFDALEDNAKDIHMRRAKQIKYLVDPSTTAQDVALKRWGMRYANGTAEQRAQIEAAAQTYISRAAVDLARIQAYGYDVNWGFEDRRLFGVIMADLPGEVVEDLIMRELDETRHVYQDPEYVRFRRWRVPYESLLPGGVVVQLQNPNQVVNLDRTGTVFTKVQIRQAL